MEQYFSRGFFYRILFRVRSVVPMAVQQILVMTAIGVFADEFLRLVVRLRSRFLYDRGN